MKKSTKKAGDTRGPALSLRLSDGELAAVERLKDHGETVQGFLRRLLRIHAKRKGVHVPPPAPPGPRPLG